MNNQDPHFFGLKYLNSLMMRIWDLGWEKVGSGSATLVTATFFVPVQVECKKAQPKEVVQAANTAALLGKRVILGNLGMMPSLTMLPQLSPAQPQPLSTPSLQAALQQQLAASLGTVYLSPSPSAHPHCRQHCSSSWQLH
jgi:hypothetical protein